MNVKIGAKIKALRKRDDVTQEKLAEVLGVTGQAVSKWESGIGYPDIEYITPLANFFNVTIDFLFDHDGAEKRRKIDEYCKKYDTHKQKMTSPQEQVEMMRQALAEFPAEEKLLFRLAESLCQKWASNGLLLHKVDGELSWNYEGNKSHDSWEEAVKIMEELLSTSLDDSIRSQCRLMLATIYGKIGEKDKVKEIAEKCPACKTGMLARELDGEEGKMHKQLSLINSMSCIQQLYDFIVSNINDLDVKTEAHIRLIDLYKIVFSDGNFGFENGTMENLYQKYAEALIEADKIDEAFESLEHAFEYAKANDHYNLEAGEKGEYQYTSPLTNLVKEYRWYIGRARNTPKLLLDNLKYNNPCYIKIRNDSRYNILVSKIEAYIAEL